MQLVTVTKVQATDDARVFSCTSKVVHPEFDPPVIEEGVLTVYDPSDPYSTEFDRSVGQWLMDHQDEYTVLPYVPPADPGPQPYRISKSTPWIRMTDEEAELITGAMQQAPSRQKGIYDAATYLSSDDPLWSSLHDMIATTLNSSTRADELLAPEA